MSASEPTSTRAGLPGRVLGMLVRPSRTLDAAATEPGAQRDLWVGYILPLAAIAPVCGAIGLFLFGASIAGVGIHIRTTVPEALLGAAVDYVLALVAVYLLTLLVDFTAPVFGGRSDRVQALKLVGYAGTAVWLAGVFDLYPTLGFPLGILGGLWSLYCVYVGLPLLMKSPRGQSLNYFATILVVTVILALALRLAAGFIR